MRATLGAQHPTRGFSLVALIVVLVIASVLAAIALPRLVESDAFEARGFFDAAQAATRYAQKLAVAQRRNVHVVVTASSLSLCYDGGCGSSVTDPVRSTPFVLSVPNGVTLAGANIFFDGLGRPSAGATFSVTDSDGARTFVVEADTGYVHP